MTEINNNLKANMYADWLYTYLFDAISAFIVLVAAIVILVASIKLYKNRKSPGVNYIFYSTTGTLISFVIYNAYSLIFSNEENQLFEQIAGVLFSLFFALGACGFWLLTKYLINEKSRQQPG